MFETKLRKVGNSHAVLLPAEVVRYWGLRPGDSLTLAFDANRLIIAPAESTVSREEFIEAVSEIVREDDAILRDLAE